jgi:hypothetical protein
MVFTIGKRIQVRPQKTRFALMWLVDKARAACPISERCGKQSPIRTNFPKTAT